MSLFGDRPGEGHAPVLSTGILYFVGESMFSEGLTGLLLPGKLNLRGDENYDIVPPGGFCISATSIESKFSLFTDSPEDEASAANSPLD